MSAVKQCTKRHALILQIQHLCELQSHSCSVWEWTCEMGYGEWKQAGISGGATALLLSLPAEGQALAVCELVWLQTGAVKLCCVTWWSPWCLLVFLFYSPFTPPQPSRCLHDWNAAPDSGTRQVKCLWSNWEMKAFAPLLTHFEFPWDC